MKGLVNVFGGKGQIGSYYCSKNPNTLINDKYDLVPKLDNATDILYFISTVDNYHIKTNPYIDIETNLITLIKVLENFRHLNRENVVFNFVSSWFVYGDTELPAKETSYCNPKGFYSITKRTAEQLLISYCETYKLNYRILRLANVVGNHDKNFSTKKNALTFLLNELKNHRPINLYDHGDFYRDFIHVSDVISAINLVMEKGRPNGIFNIGNGEIISFKKIIDFAVEYYNSRSQIANIEQPEFHKTVQVKSMYLDNSKIKALGYEPKFSVFDFVKQFK